MGGGKSSKSKTSVTIPPEVLARYNAVNTRAESVANTPFQQYSSDPSAFVAPLSSTQQAGVANTNAAVGMAQPYYQQATGQLMSAQNTATPFYGQAANDITGAQGIGDLLGSSSAMALASGFNNASPFNQSASNAYGGAYAGAQPYNMAATGLAGAGAQNVDPSDLNSDAINKYLSPYLGTVLQGTAGLLNQNNQQQQAGQMGNAIRSGAFGGDRAGIAAANLSQQQNLANSQIYSGILNQGYGQALSTAQQQQGVGLAAGQANREAYQNAANQFAAIGQQQYGQGMGLGQAQQGLGQQIFGQGSQLASQLASLGQQQFGQGLAAAQGREGIGQGLYGMGSSTSQQLANLGSGSQSAALQGAQAQMAAGQTEQQTQQAGLTALYNQFLQQQSYPFQVSQFLANIAEGTGALSGSTTTTSQPGGFFSDERLKDDIEKVGKTFDGQPIYSYRYKGDPRKQIGLIAQDVEKSHPEAVGLAGGYRTVDYGKATKAAAERGKFASGGSSFVDPWYNDHDRPRTLEDAIASIRNFDGQKYDSGGSVDYDPTWSALKSAGLATPRMANAASDDGQSGGGGGLPFAGMSAAGSGKPSGNSLNLQPLIQQAWDGLNAKRVANGQDPHSATAPIVHWKKAEGGLAGFDPELMKAILENQRNSFGPFGQAGLYGSSSGAAPRGGSSYVPEANLSVHEMLRAADPPPPPQSGLSQIKEVTDLGSKIKGGIDSIKGRAPKTSDSGKPDDYGLKDEGADGELLQGLNFASGGLAPNDDADHKPYLDEMTGPGLKIPDKKPTAKLPEPAQPQGQQSGLGVLGELAGIGASIASIFADGGSVKPSLDPMTLLRTLLSSNTNNDNEDETPTAPVQDAPKPSAPSTFKPLSFETPRPNRGILNAILGAEGTGKNPRSSARGRGQIIDSTFKNFFKRMFPDRAKDMDDTAILSLRNSPEAGGLYDRMIPEIHKDNLSALSGAKIEATPGASYLAWFLGPHGAVKTLKADPSTPISAIIGSDAINANPSILRGKTAGEVSDWASHLMARKMGSKRGGRIGFADGGEVDDTTDPDRVLASGLSEPDTEAYSQPVASEPTNILPKGLAAAEQPEHRGFLDKLGNRIAHPGDKPDLILPILQGLAAMGTAPTRHFGVALASGLGAGAQAYQGQKQYQQHNRALNISQQLANAKTIMAPIEMASRRFTSLGDGRFYDNFMRETIGLGEYRSRLQQQMTAGGQQSGQAATPMAGAPTEPPGGPPTPETPAAPPQAAPVTPPATDHGGTKPSGPVTPTQAIYDKVNTIPEVSTLKAESDRLTDQATDYATKAADPSLVGTPEGNRYLSLASTAREQANIARDKYYRMRDQFAAPQIQAAVSHAENMQQQSDAKTAQATKFIQEAYPPTEQILRSMVGIYANTETNRLSGALSDLIGNIRSIPGIGSGVGDAMMQYQAAHDEATKDAARLAIQNAVSSGLGDGAPASSLATAIQTVADPGYSPYAKFKIIGQSMALLEREKDMNNAWLTRPDPNETYAEFAQKWNTDKGHSAKAYEKNIFAKMPTFKGMTPDQMAEHPRPGRAPKPDELIEGHVYDSPKYGKVIYRDGAFYPLKGRWDNQ